MNKVYLVMEYYRNSEYYEEFQDKDTPIQAFGSKEDAEEFIKAMPIPIKEIDYSGGIVHECDEKLEKTEDNCWKRKGDEMNRAVLWEVTGAIRAFALRNKYGTDQYYAYYILEVPFGKEKEDE